MSVIDTIISRANADPKHIVLPEGEDERIVQASVRAVRSGLANITLLGDEKTIRSLCRHAGDLTGQVTVTDPGVEGISSEPSAVLNFANGMVKDGRADGSLAGAVHKTGDVLRSALKTIGLATQNKIVSSFFLIQPRTDPGQPESCLVFADCAIRVDPNASQLAEIAISAADNFRAVQDQTPKVALLSFATFDSANHASLDKIKKAVTLIKDRRSDLIADGPIQFDAAFVPEIGRSKAPDSSVAGQANVFIFPDLNSGNIAYKIAERIGGAKAIGPILQGLNRPANDLSRGCDADDVYNMIAVTVLQSQTIA